MRSDNELAIICISNVSSLDWNLVGIVLSIRFPFSNLDSLVTISFAAGGASNTDSDPSANEAPKSVFITHVPPVLPSGCVASSCQL